jgi:hypothetical protein
MLENLDLHGQMSKSSVFEFYTITNDLRPSGCLTKRAPDLWESARLKSIFIHFRLYLLSGIISAHPQAGNANRWAARDVESTEHKTYEI